MLRTTHTLSTTKEVVESFKEFIDVSKNGIYLLIGNNNKCIDIKKINDLEKLKNTNNCFLIFNGGIQKETLQKLNINNFKDVIILKNCKYLSLKNYYER